MLVDLDHTKSRSVIFVDQRLDARGFARACVAVEENVVRGNAAQERFRVFRERFFLYIVSHHIGKHDLIRVIDGKKFNLAVRIFDTERAVQTEHTDTVQMVKFRDPIEKFVFIRRLRQLFAECLHLFANAAVIILFRLRNRPIVGQRGEAVNAKRVFQFGKVEVKQSEEDAAIVFREMIDGAFARAFSFGGEGEGIFVRDQIERQIVLPEIFIKAVGGREVENMLDLRINTAHERIFVDFPTAEIAEDIRKRKENRIFFRIAEKEQARGFSVHNYASRIAPLSAEETSFA